MQKSDTGPAIAWLDWGPTAFARATREDKPILLALVAPWCEHCAAMDRTTYSSADVARVVETRFVPVRVDTDRRPDINERYNVGGWPTTVFLTPNGEILAGGTFVERERMLTVLARVADAFTGRRGEIEAKAGDVRALHETGHREPSDEARTSPAASVTRDDPLDWLSARLLEVFDADQGGFGVGPKFPQVPALTLALERHADTGDRRFARIVTISLDQLSRLFDEIEGGFFRYASHRDWSAPHTEKILQDNAELIRLYLDAGEALNRAEYLDRARRAIDWVHRVLARPDEGGFAASQAADRLYYEADSADARSSRVPPRVDPTQYTDANAAMIGVYLRAAEVIGDDRLREFALRSLERTALVAYRPGAGIAHVIAPDSDDRGLLADHVRAAEALLLAHTVAGRLPYSMLAAELMEHALSTMWDEEHGGFRDHAAERGHAEHGLLRHPLRPFVMNCEAARVLSRLSIVTGRAPYRDRAQRTLSSLGHSYRDEPLQGAAYGLAVREVRDGRLPRGWSLSYVDWRLQEPDDD